MTALPIVERPALAATLAALTDRPIGHWIAELRSTAWVGTSLTCSPRGVSWEVRRWPGRAGTDARHCPWSIVPASKAVLGRDADGTVRYDVRGEHVLTPDEGTDALITRSVLPLDFADDPARAFACGECGGSGQAPAFVGRRVQCPLCAEDCPACGGVGKVAGVVCATCGGETIVTNDRSPGAQGRPRDFEALVAWSSLGPDTILQAETHARDAARAEREAWRAIQREDMVARRPAFPRVAWRVIPSRKKLLEERRVRFHANPSRAPQSDRARIEQELAFGALFETRAEDAVGGHLLPFTFRGPMARLWQMGLALDRIDRYGVVIACPGFLP